MNLFIAFDKFKDSMSAVRACDAAANGAQRALSMETICTRAPLTDGGEGFCRILTEAASGYIEYYPVIGPLGEEIDAPLGWVESEKVPTHAREMLGLKGGNVAVIEMAAVAGLELVPSAQRHPGHCTTRGVGELIRSAVAKEASAILLGIGGSATSDLGLGALGALGFRFNGTRTIYPSDWQNISAITGQPACSFPPIYIACDVANPLLGPEGAAYVYGPQKGLPENEIPDFDIQAARMADLLCRYVNQPEEFKNLPGSGAAGGIGFGLKVACGAEFVPGFELVASWLDISGKVAEADLILTGEGKFDTSSLSGKGPYSLLAAAHAADKSAILFAGGLETAAVEIARARFPQASFHPISPVDLSLEEALLKGPELLELTVENILSQRFKE